MGEETTDGRWYVLTPDGRVLYASAESKALLSRSIYDMAVLPQLPVIAPEQVVSVTILTPERTVAFLTDEEGVPHRGRHPSSVRNFFLINRGLQGLLLSKVFSQSVLICVICGEKLI